MQESKNISQQIYDYLLAQTHKQLTRYEKKKIDPAIGYCALQNAASNYLGKVTLSVCDGLEDLTVKLDHIEQVRDQINKILDNLKTQIKSVELN